MQGRYHFHHPFTKSSIGILLANSSDNDLIEKLSVILLEDVHLYYQPLEHPIIAMLFFFIKFFFIVIGIILCSKVLTMVKKNPSIDSKALMVFCWIQILFQPTLVFFDLTVNLIHPVDEIIGTWLCSFGSLFYSFSTKFVLTHSFFSALMRYIFILHNDVIRKYGIERFKKYFLYLSLVICFFGVFVDGIDTRELSRLSFINKCYGKDHKVFLIESSTLNVLKRKFWTIEGLEAFEKYGETWKEIISMLLKVLRLVKTLIFLLTGFNVVESILYFQIFAFMKRYVTNRIHNCF